MNFTKKRISEVKRESNNAHAQAKARLPIKRGIFRRSLVERKHGEEEKQHHAATIHNNKRVKTTKICATRHSASG